jgi:hypothetical protein
LQQPVPKAPAQQQPVETGEAQRNPSRRDAPRGYRERGGPRSREDKRMMASIRAPLVTVDFGERILEPP